MNTTPTTKRATADRNIRVELSLLSGLQHMAERNRRSLTQEVNFILERAVTAEEKKGNIPSTTERVGQ